jgi:hypothetical protein
MKYICSVSFITGCCLGIELFTAKEELVPTDQLAIVFDLFIIRIIIRKLK